MQNNEKNITIPNMYERKNRNSIFTNTIYHFIRKNIEASDRESMVSLTKITFYDQTGELELSFQVRYTKMLLMCIESKIDTDEVWEALKDMYLFDTDLIDEVQCHKKSIEDLKKIWEI